MIKKMILVSSILACGITATETIAQPLICPFTDYFTISGPIGLSIGELRLDGNLSGKIEDSFKFTTSCKSNGNTGSGHAYLTVGVDTRQCSLTILDGPFENNPVIMSANCTGGLKYTGMDHETGSYSYKLKFA